MNLRGDFTLASVFFLTKLSFTQSMFCKLLHVLLLQSYKRRLGPPAPTSLSSRSSPHSVDQLSLSSSLPGASPRSVPAKAPCAATASMPDHLRRRQYAVVLRMSAGAVRAFACASNSRKVHASSDHLPPTSIAATSSLQRLAFSSSGYLRSFILLASSKRAPSVLAALG